MQSGQFGTAGEALESCFSSGRDWPLSSSGAALCAVPMSCASLGSLRLQGQMLEGTELFSVGRERGCGSVHQSGLSPPTSLLFCYSTPFASLLDPLLELGHVFPVPDLCEAGEHECWISAGGIVPLGSLRTGGGRMLRKQGQLVHSCELE